MGSLQASIHVVLLIVLLTLEVLTFLNMVMGLDNANNADHTGIERDI